MRIRFVLGAFFLLLTLPTFARDVDGQILSPRRRPARNAVVYLEGASRSVPAMRAVMDQRDRTFIPHVLPVTVGSTVAFPNNDSVLHNVFAYYEAARFDLGLYARGITKTRRFDKPGVIALLCNIHPDMSAYVIVVDTPYFGVTDAAGRFRIRDVPPGTYTLKVWHESGSSYSESLVVTGSDVPLTLALVHK